MKLERYSTVVAAAILNAGMASPATASDISVSTRGDRVERCSDLRFTFDERDAATAEEQFTIPRSAARGFRARLPENAGAYLRGWEGEQFGVTVCKAAATAGGLAGIIVSEAGGEVHLRGPKGQDWVAYLLVRAPRDAAVELEASNGPIALADLSGPLSVRTVNGPISIEECSGRVDARAENGPISLEGCSGEGEALAENGPIHFQGNRGRSA